MAVVGEASDGREAMTHVHRWARTESGPDVVLMDLMMEPVNDIEATTQIQAAYSAIQVVALTSFLKRRRCTPPSTPCRRDSCL
jgi:NarL family two-component system response regulator LiaR